jgi:hypothetical protein
VADDAHQHQKTRMNLAVLAIARAAGVEPSPDHWPHLRRALLFGPLTSSCFRLEGPDALPDASARFARDAAWFGAIASNDLADREQKYWSLVQDTMADELSPRNLPAKGADRMFRTDSAADFYSHALAFDPRRTSRRP